MRTMALRGTESGSVAAEGFAPFRYESVQLPDGRSYLEVVAEDKAAVAAALDGFYVAELVGKHPINTYTVLVSRRARGQSGAAWAGDMRARGYGTVFTLPTPDGFLYLSATDRASDAAGLTDSAMMSYMTSYVLMPPPNGWQDLGQQPQSPTAPAPRGPTPPTVPASRTPDRERVQYKLSYWLTKPVVVGAIALGAVGGVAYWWSQKR